MEAREERLFWVDLMVVAALLAALFASGAH